MIDMLYMSLLYLFELIYSFVIALRVTRISLFSCYCFESYTTSFIHLLLLW